MLSRPAHSADSAALRKVWRATRASPEQTPAIRFMRYSGQEPEASARCALLVRISTTSSAEYGEKLTVRGLILDLTLSSRSKRQPSVFDMQISPTLPRSSSA